MTHANQSLGSQNGDSNGTIIDHTRLVAPKVDLGRMIYPVPLPLGATLPIDLRNPLYGFGASAPAWGLGVTVGADPITALSVAAGGFGAGFMASKMADRSDNSPRDRLRTITRGAMLSRSDGLTSDEILDYEGGCPIHGIKRIYDDGTLEMVDGRRVAFIRSYGPNTEKKSQMDEQAVEGEASEERLSEGLAAGIRDNVEGDFRWYMTTAEEVVDDYVEQLKAAAYSRFAGPEYELLREYLHDIIRYEEADEPSYWEASQTLTYAVVEVSESDVRTPSESAMSRVEDIRSRMAGLSTNDDTPRTRTRARRSSDAALARQLKSKLDDRVSGMKAAIESAKGAKAERVGPTEVAMLASKYWSGADIDMSMADGELSQTNLSVWPSIDEAVSGEGSPTHRPTAVERAIEREHSDSPSEVEKIVAGVESVSAMSDDDGVAASRDMQSPWVDDTGTPEEVFEGDTTAQQIAAYGARLREHLLGMASGTEVNAEDSTISPEQTAMAPSTYKPVGEFIRVGDEYVKTFWVTGFSETPQPNFLKGLQENEHFTDDDADFGRVDFDLCIRVSDMGYGDAEDYLGGALDKLGIEIEDDEDQVRIGSLNSVEDYYYIMAFLLASTSNTVRPWRVNGYLTVRAGTKQAIKTAQDQIESGYISDEEASLDFGRLEALEYAEESTVDALRDRMTGLVLKEDPGMIDVLFKSGFPANRDLYNEKTGIERSQLCFTGALGAMLPLAVEPPQESGGAIYGRHRMTGLKMYADQFARGKAPHGLGLGDSGSSKTFSKGLQYLVWWAMEEGRTVVALDTMGGFHPHIKLACGNYVPVDGTTTVNPFAASPVTGSTTGEDVKIGDMTFQAAKDWILQEIENQGGNPNSFSQTVEQLIMLMYKNHNIDIYDPSTYDNGDPNMVNFIETMDYFEEHPEEGTLGDSNSETGEIEKEIKGLKRNLAGFSKLGRNHHMVGEGEVELEPGEFNYLDLEHVEQSSGGADKSAMLQLMLRQVYELVKRAPKETVFLIDEAHFLIQSERTREWISKSSRHWRHFNARIENISHRPDEYISGAEDPEGHKDNIRGQCSTIEFWRLEGLKDEHAEAFGLNEKQANYIRKQAVTGDSDEPYSTSIVQFTDREGWWTNHIRTGPVATAVHSWDPADHGPFEPFIRYIINGGNMAEYEELWELGETPHQREQMAGSGYNGPQPSQPETPQPAATDGGNSLPPRDENGRFVPTGGDD